MKNKNLVIIFSHCDNDDKIKILKDNINEVKNNGFDILLVSHLPVSIELQSLVNYFIYDESNPLLFWPERGMCHWKTIHAEEKSYRMDTMFPDTGWTVFNQILISSNLALSLDYDYYTLLNYDADITQSMIDAMNNPSNVYISRVVVTNDWNGEKEPTEKTFLPSLVFNILSKKVLSKIIPLISRENYINGKGGSDIDFGDIEDLSHEEIKHERFSDSEHYFYNLINNFEYKVHPELVREKYSFKPESERGGIQPFNFNVYNKFFKIYIDYSTSNLLIYDVNKPITIIINESESIIDKNCFIGSKVESLGFYNEDVYIDLLPIVSKLKNSIVTRTIKEK